MTVGKKRHLGFSEGGSWQLGGKYKQVSSCKLKVSGKGWLLPNIQSRKWQALTAAGEKRWCYQNLKTLLIFFKVSSASTDLNWSHKHLPSLREGEASSPPLKLSLALCVPLMALQLQTKLVVPSETVKFCSVIEKSAEFHPERVHMCVA